MKEIYGVFGAGGYGREVMPLAQIQTEARGKPVDNLFFVVDAPNTSEVNGVEVISLTEFSKKDAAKKHLTCAIADSKFRSTLKNKMQHLKISEWSVIAENSILMSHITIGPGAIISPFVTITSNVIIGLSFHANLYSYVAHDCVIGDFVTFAPGVKCNGNVVIKNHAYVGTGAIIKPENPLQ